MERLLPMRPTPDPPTPHDPTPPASDADLAAIEVGAKISAILAAAQSGSEPLYRYGCNGETSIRWDLVQRELLTVTGLILARLRRAEATAKEWLVAGRRLKAAQDLGDDVALWKAEHELRELAIGNA